MRKRKDVRSRCHRLCAIPRHVDQHTVLALHHDGVLRTSSWMATNCNLATSAVAKAANGSRFYGYDIETRIDCRVGVGTECLRRELQWTPAGRVPKRDAVHVVAASTPGARRLATRLQQRSPAFWHRLARASCLCCSIRTAMGQGATLRQWLHTLAHCSTQSDGEYQPSDSGRDWMKGGGIVRLFPTPRRHQRRGTRSGPPARSARRCR